MSLTAKLPFGKPQMFALALLAAYAAQCLWVASAAPFEPEEISYIHYWDSPERYSNPEHTPFIYQIAGNWGLALENAGLGSAQLAEANWYLRLPFIIFGLLRGASLWYVVRRLYGERGAYLALALYSFSPRMVAEGSHVWPDVLASWGCFGAVFAAIATAHTLYAPLQVSSSRRRLREVLMGLGLGVGIAAQFPVVLAAPVTFAFVLYLVPVRRLWGALAAVGGTAIALFVLLTVYAFRPAVFANGLLNAWWISLRMRPLGLRFQTLLGLWHETDWAFLALLAVALVTWMAWKRARYFANTAPLLVAIVIVLFAPLLSVDLPWRMWIPAVPFVLIFIGGIFADLLDTSRQKMVITAAAVLVVADVALSLYRIITTYDLLTR